MSKLRKDFKVSDVDTMVNGQNKYLIHTIETKKKERNRIKESCNARRPLGYNDRLSTDII